MCLGVAACSKPEEVGRQPPATEVSKGRLPATAVPFTGLFDAIELQTYWLGPDDDPDTLLIRLPHQDYDAEIIARPKTGISAEQAMLQGNLALLIGSGFVATQNGLQPVGLLQSEGRTLSAVQSHGYTRILGLSEKGPGVIHRQNYETNIFHSALQAGPGIIEKGLLDISERDLQRPAYFRSFVGLCEKEWLLGISLKPAHLRTLGEQLMTFIAAQEMACDEVVNLAGDRQAVLMVRDPEDNLIYHGDPHTYKVSLIGFQMRP